nr:ABC transporter ATP-binding protein [Clostridium sp. 'deep sea']
MLPNFWMKLMKKRGTDDWKMFSELSAYLLDVFQGMETIKSFNATENIKKEVKKKSYDIHRGTMKHLAVSQVESGFLQFSAAIGASLAIAVAAYLAGKSIISSEYLFIILFLVSSCFSPIYTLINTWHLGFRGVSASNFLLEILNVQEKMNIFNNKKSLSQVESIQLKNISFSYGNDKQVLKNINLSLKSGSITAIVGKSGEGKSTIVNLILGFITTQCGEVLINNIAITDFEKESYRNSISVMWQDPYMFYGTILENIMVGKPSATIAEVVQAAKRVNIHDYIMSLPQQYNSFVGERGMTLSGGQKQRISLARCLLRDSPVIILDEPSSALDGENEIIIQKTLKELAKSKIILIISHRLQTINFADNIAILKNGVINTQGSHNELLKNSELYNQLMNIKESINYENK